jgi:heptosyltransferase-1
MTATIIPLTTEPRRIVLIKPSALGDIMHSLPVLHSLRRRFPDAHVAWVVNRIYEPVLRGHPDLDAIIPFDRGALRAGWFDGALAFADFLRRLRLHRFDLAIDLQGLFRTGLMTLATGARQRIGLASAREGATWFYHHRIDDQQVKHAVDRYGLIAESLGADARDKVFTVPVDDIAKAWAKRQLANCPRPWIAVGVGARWLTKRWPPEHFAALARRAIEHFGGTALFVGAPDETQLAQQAAALVPYPVCQLTGKTNLPQLIALLSEADVMLANDTGPLHVAVALGRPVVAPYTCTLVERTGPYGQAARAVETTVPCRGSCIRTCDRMDCMAELTPDRLWLPLREILHAWEQRTHAA